MSKLRLWFFIVFVGIHSGCSIETFELRLEIQGTVKNAANGMAIPGAQVVLSRVQFNDTEILESAATDDQGSYEIVLEFDDEHNCADTQLVLHAEKSNYINQYVTYNEVTSRYVQCMTGIQTFDFQLVKF